MSAKSVADLIAESEALLPDNLTQEISASDERTIAQNIYDSFLNITDGGLVVVALAGYSTELTPTDNKHFIPKKYFDDAISGLSIPVLSDVAYDATSWNANLDGATKNALRDKFVSVDAAQATAFTNGGNNFGGDAILGLTSNHNLSIYTNNSERIKITSTGLVAVANKLLVGDTDTSLLSTRDFVVAGSGNTSGSDCLTLYNSDFGSPILRVKNDGALLLSTALQDSGGVDIMDIPNRTFKSNSGADRVDCNGAGLYFSGLRLDWQNRLFLGQWTMDDEDLKFNLDTKGPILKDRTLGTYHRLVLNGGILSIEAE
jgi:hypothetical protein